MSRKNKKATTPAPKHEDADIPQTSLRDPAALEEGDAIGQQALRRPNKPRNDEAPPLSTPEQLAEHEEQGEPRAIKGSVIPANVKRSYGKDQNNGDNVAQRLKGLTRDQLVEEADRWGIDFGRWSHLNFGMQRMNLGNVIRRLQRVAEEAAAKQAEFAAKKPE